MLSYTLAAIGRYHCVPPPMRPRTESAPACFVHPLSRCARGVTVWPQGDHYTTTGEVESSRPPPVRPYLRHAREITEQLLDFRLARQHATESSHVYCGHPH